MQKIVQKAQYRKIFSGNEKNAIVDQKQLQYIMLFEKRQGSAWNDEWRIVQKVIDNFGQNVKIGSEIKNRIDRFTGFCL